MCRPERPIGAQTRSTVVDTTACQSHHLGDRRGLVGEEPWHPSAPTRFVSSSGSGARIRSWTSRFRARSPPTTSFAHLRGDSLAHLDRSTTCTPVISAVARPVSGVYGGYHLPSRRCVEMGDVGPRARRMERPSTCANGSWPLPRRVLLGCGRRVPPGGTPQRCSEANPNDSGCRRSSRTT